MPQVIIVNEFKGERAARPQTMDEMVVKRHSRLLRRSLNAIPPNEHGSPKEVTIHGCGGPINHVLDAIQAYGQRDNFHLDLRGLNMPIEAIAMLWKACEALEIDPRQTHLRTRLRWDVTHQKLTSKQLIALDHVLAPSKDFRLRNEKFSTWEAMVHQTAWFVEYNDYSAHEIVALAATVQEQAPILFEAITDRIAYLHRRRVHAEEMRARAERMEINRRFAEHLAAKRARKEEELRGERELSEHTARQVMSRPPPTLWADVQEGKHGQRKPAGQGWRSRKVSGEATKGGDGKA